MYWGEPSGPGNGHGGFGFPLRVTRHLCQMLVLTTCPLGSRISALPGGMPVGAGGAVTEGNEGQAEHVHQIPAERRMDPFG